MSTQEQYLLTLRCRIAANLLYKRNSLLHISMTNNPFYDLLVEDSNSGLRFGVKVGGKDYDHSEVFLDSYLTKLSHYYLCDKEEIDLIPICLMCVDEVTEEGRCGLLVSFIRNKPEIIKEPMLRALSKSGYNGLIKELYESDYVIRFLDMKLVGILKTIVFENPCDLKAQGKVVYRRNFTDTYRMPPPREEGDKDRFDHYLHGPSQEEYPSDELDRVILSAIRSRYTNVKLNNSLLIFNRDYKDLRRDYGDLPRKSIVIQVEPILDPDTFHYLGELIRCPRIGLSLYIDNPLYKDIFSDLIIQYTIEKENWSDIYDKIITLQPTLTDLSKIIG